MLDKLTDRQIEDLIHNEIIGRIGCHADNITYIVPVGYAYDGTYIYGRTYEGMKLDMMRKNPNVCFQVDNTKDMANWQSVICWGEFEELNDDNDAREKAIYYLTTRELPLQKSKLMVLSPDWPFVSSHCENIEGVIFRIRITKKTGRFEKTNAEILFAT